jgi:hypothetical protein
MKRHGTRSLSMFHKRAGRGVRKWIVEGLPPSPPAPLSG